MAPRQGHHRKEIMIDFKTRNDAARLIRDVILLFVTFRVTILTVLVGTEENW